ncbi:CAP domain-containing protein [Dactylonectria estremocensis]|uniref:CAP domain-containing protein n=1 Tax=Dactylonectria estremocensis TaxID=1079267 RepID=A0A9P9DC52_9HYPO|nr:CAP domain-containing protein [Dactylonectria estremocensis]
MHFSALVMSTLAANAAAWNFPYRGGHRWHTQVVTEVEIVTEAYTVVAPVTKVATTAAAVVTTVQAEAPQVTLTTLITRKASTSSKTTAAAVKTTAAAAADSSSSLTTDQQNALDAHNAARSDVGNADLVWDDALAADAQEWATHLVSVGSLVHSSTDGQGENLYMQYGTDAPYKNAVDAFVSEKSLYNGEAISETNYMNFGHYTQVVWGSTTKLGMAIATGSNGEVYVVARYTLPGNYIGETPY